MLRVWAIQNLTNQTNDQFIMNMQYHAVRAEIMIDFFPVNNFVLILTVLFVGFSLINAIYGLFFNAEFHPICKK